LTIFSSSPQNRSLNLQPLEIRAINMLVSSELSQASTVHHLVNIWADRYLPNLSILSRGIDPDIRARLREAVTAAGRAQTAAKLPPPLVEDTCKLAAVRVKEMYDHLPKVCDLLEALRLAQFSSRVYLQLLEVYQASSDAVKPLPETPRIPSGDAFLSAWGIPKIDTLASTLEPLLLEFQEQYVVSKDWRTLGFITTQINFSNALLLEQLTPAEQVLITPYFTFLEEQVALPWQRICAAAEKWDAAAPEFILVKQMLPRVPEIARAAYLKLSHSFPGYSSRRGRLTDSSIKHSCLRDFSMFQAYLWLCLLQGSLRTIEQELVALCVMVLECVDVPWEMTLQGTHVLIDEIQARLSPDQKKLVEPYTTGLLQAFQQWRG
jgi:hypothetical protein